MDINYTNILSFLYNTSWKDLILPLLGAGFGSWMAYKLNNRQENQRQYSNERAHLIKLVYDLNISAKTLCYYYNNILSEIKSISNKSHEYNIPILLTSAKLNLEQYGFISKESAKFYEILTYAKEDIDYIINENEILIREIDYPSKDYIRQLYSIFTTIPKVITKIYVCLLNANSFLNKYYKTDNLLKDNVLNAIKRIKKVIHITNIYYAKIISKNNFESKYLNKNILKTYKKVLKIDLNYINEILNTWALDFR